MADCPRCGTDNPGHARFCLGCGVVLGVAPSAPPAAIPIATPFDEAAGAVAMSERDHVPVNEARLSGVRGIDRLAARGDLAARVEVERALALVADSPYLNQRADLSVEAGEALRLLGEIAGASRHLDEALRLADLKENVALAGQIRARRRALPAPFGKFV